jgi:hypothetical protein
MFSGDVDAELRRLADDPNFPHGDAARRAVRFRASGDVADLVAIRDDPHPCGMTEVVFAMAGSTRPWLNWVPMPSEAISNLANEIGGRRARGEQLQVNGLGALRRRAGQRHECLPQDHRPTRHRHRRVPVP